MDDNLTDDEHHQNSHAISRTKEYPSFTSPPPVSSSSSLILDDANRHHHLWSYNNNDDNHPHFMQDYYHPANQFFSLNSGLGHLGDGQLHGQYVDLESDHTLSALALTRLFKGSAEEVLNSLSPEQLIELGKNVRKLKKSSPPAPSKKKHNTTATPITKRTSTPTGMLEPPKFLPPAPASTINSFTLDKPSQSESSAFDSSSRLQDATDGYLDNSHSPHLFGMLSAAAETAAQQPPNRFLSSSSPLSYVPFLSSPSYGFSSGPPHHLSTLQNPLSSLSSESPSFMSGLNLPASSPYTNVRDGIEWLIFTYSTKGAIQEYQIRVNIDTIDAENLPEEFRRENCVYPRAVGLRSTYSGNRYEYESTVNDLAWRLTWLNHDILSGKRGLIQRAVDSYRNRFQESRSRRVIRQEKIMNGTLRRRADNEIYHNHHLNYTPHILPERPSTCSPHFQHHTAAGLSPESALSPIFVTNIAYNDKKDRHVTARIRMDIDSVDCSLLDWTFRHQNTIFPLDSVSSFELSINEIACKLAFLNTSKLAGKRFALIAAVDAFRERFGSGDYVNNNAHNGNNKNGDAGDICRDSNHYFSSIESSGPALPSLSSQVLDTSSCDPSDGIYFGGHTFENRCQKPLIFDGQEQRFHHQNNLYTRPENDGENEHTVGNSFNDGYNMMQRILDAQKPPSFDSTRSTKRSSPKLIGRH